MVSVFNGVSILTPHSPSPACHPPPHRIFRAGPTSTPTDDGKSPFLSQAYLMVPDVFETCTDSLERQASSSRPRLLYPPRHCRRLSNAHPPFWPVHMPGCSHTRVLEQKSGHRPAVLIGAAPRCRSDLWSSPPRHPAPPCIFPQQTMLVDYSHPL